MEFTAFYGTLGFKQRDKQQLLILSQLNPVHTLYHISFTSKQRSLIVHEIQDTSDISNRKGSAICNYSVIENSKQPLPHRRNTSCHVRSVYLGSYDIALFIPATRLQIRTQFCVQDIRISPNSRNGSILCNTMSA